MNLSTAAVIKNPYQSVFEKKITDVFCEEIEKRSGIDLRNNKAADLTVEFYQEQNPAACPDEIRDLFAGIRKPGKEGFRIRMVTENNKERLIVLGADERGEFYGMARILRKSYIKNGKIECPKELDGLSMTPQYPMRGHQLGFRDKNNTYSAWTIADYERYIRDMALFGANAIELLPPKTDDALFSSTFVEDPFELMIEVSRIIHSYNMDVWLWYPNVGRNYDDLDCMYKELKERERIYSSIPYLDAILVPLGDPGSLWPTDAMKVTEQFVKIMHRYHPNAGVWIAPQHFQPEPGWYEDFYKGVAEEPDWITGICFAPWEQHSVTEMQEMLPERYRHNIRNYPDISHNSNCQFPVPMWDNAFAMTLGREGFNPRPEGMKYIHNLIEPHTCGAITYSEGIHDDINKVIWCDQDFDSSMPAKETMEDYVRLLIDADLAQDLSKLVLAAEKNWEGPVLKNENIDLTYAEMQRIDKEADQKTKENARYQMIKLRIFSDYWTKYKYAFDQEQEKKAREVLDQAAKLGSAAAIKEARSILNLCKDTPGAEEVLCEMQKLADDLYRSCRIQLTVTMHHGQRWIRGAYMETAAMPLNEYQYLMQFFKRIEKLESEEDRVKALLKLNDRIHPGEGNQYLSLGSYEGFAHVKQYHTWEEDPGFLKTPMKDHSIYSILGMFHGFAGWYNEFPMPLSWAWNATAIYGTPLEVEIDGLDPKKEYKLAAFYPNAFLKAVHHMQKPTDDVECRFWINDTLIAETIGRLDFAPDVRWEYEIPKDCYQDGRVTLKWQVYGTLKAFALSELWILEKK